MKGNSWGGGDHMGRHGFADISDVLLRGQR